MLAKKNITTWVELEKEFNVGKLVARIKEEVVRRKVFAGFAQVWRMISE